MRLSANEINTIRKTIKKKDKDALIYLFGSRIDNRKKGGDIDLLIFSQNLRAEDKYKIKQTLWEQLGEQKIDIVLVKDESDPFTRIVLKEAVLI